MRGPTTAAEVALDLARHAPTSEVLYALAPLAAPLLGGQQPWFHTRLDAEHARTLASRGLGNGMANLLALVSDDPEVLLLLLDSEELDPALQERVLRHPNVPMERLLEYDTGFEKQLVRARITSSAPSLETWQAAGTLWNGEDLAEELVRSDLAAAPFALAVIQEVPGEYERNWVTHCRNRLAHRKDLIEVLATPTPGADPDEDTLRASVTRLLAAARGDSEGLPARALRTLAKGRLSLQRGGPPELLTSLLVRSPTLWKDLSWSSELDEAAMLLLAGAAEGSADRAAQQAGTTRTEVRTRPPGELVHSYEGRAHQRALEVLQRLAERRECPDEVLGLLPARSDGMGLLARLLPPDPRQWELAATLVAEVEGITAGELVSLVRGAST